MTKKTNELKKVNKNTFIDKNPTGQYLQIKGITWWVPKKYEIVYKIRKIKKAIIKTPIKFNLKKHKQD